MNKRIALIVLIAFTLAITSCRTKRALIKAPLKERGEMFLIEKMNTAETKFDYFNSRCTITLSTDRKTKLDLKGQIRIKKDSIIWISLSPAFGIEVARMIVTVDSVRFINRLDKTYFDDDFSFIKTAFSSTIDFDLFQALLTGNDLSWYDDDNFKASVDAMEYRLTAAQRNKRKRYLKQQDTTKFLVQSIWLDPETFKIRRLHIKEFGDENIRLQAQYDRFQALNGQLYPSSLKFELSGAVKATIQIECSRMEVNSAVSFPFRIPETFSRIQ